MFGFLRKKLGEVISKFSEKAKEEKKEELKEEKQPAAKPTPATEKAEEVKAEVKPREKEKEIKEELKEKKEAKEEIGEEPKKGFFERITSAVTEAVTTTKISEARFDELFQDLEITLLENNVAVEAIDKIKAGLKTNLVEKPLQRGKVEEAVRKTLRSSIEELFISGYDFKEKIVETAAVKKPVKVMFVGINGSGKTTTIAKIAKLLQDNKLKVVIAASDTFRAAAIHQLQEHADKLGVKLMKHDYGADPAAVAFDAIKYAEAHGIDAVLIDTAGRLHSNVNLVDEMKKIARVAKPDLKIFVGEAITGNDCVEQARKFNEAIGIDGIILAKADVDEKGGAAISVSYVTQKPILFLGTGQGYNDLSPFKPELVVESLGLAA
ncbi:signal recognition particle-docking protein FtsY [Candidatus Woesearchaeota archaeon]|nr:signal recognition particle-docking protein FtsY [Candidatus Woesearchaeota archaeon]